MTVEEASNKLARAVAGRYMIVSFAYLGPRTVCQLVCADHGGFTKEFRSVVYSEQGCPRCAREAGAKRGRRQPSSLPAGILQELETKHGSTCRYDRFMYVNRRTPGIITCLKHGDHKQSVSNHLRSVHGCPSCKGVASRERSAMTWQEAKAACVRVHGERYAYPDQVYLNSQSPLLITCPEHGTFAQTLASHVHGEAGCPACVAHPRMTRAAFVKTAIATHGPAYGYGRCVFKNSAKKVEVTCVKHGSFWASPRAHVSGKGCPRCGERPLKAESRWLAGLGIPDTPFNRQVVLADGLAVCGLLNGVAYEFHGGYRCGDPRSYPPEQTHLASGRHMGSLYLEAVEKQRRVTQLGYPLFFVWEADFRAGLPRSEKNPHE